MTEQPGGGEDDWVKQMLAEAMLGRSALPAAEAAPIVGLLNEPPAAEVPASIEEETAELEEEAAEPEKEAEVEPEVRYRVVLDEPGEAEPEPAIEAAEPVADVPVEESTPLGASTSVDEPAPASLSRLFERPHFDATNDPGVEEMLADERAPRAMLEESDERSRLRGTVEWLVVLGSAVIVALLLRAFLFQAFFIPSESMEATLRVDDRVLVNKLSYRFGDVERGEIVVFRRPDDQPGEFRDLIKRVIGLPGESIEARDNTIVIDGQVLIEPYLTPGEVIGDFGPIDIPEGEYFVMGDNRDNSGDSRVFGTVDQERFIGRAFFLFWPLDRIGSL